jgi:hypothetical protein
MLGDTFGAIVSYVLIWLSLLFSASSAVKLQRVADQLVACLESIFQKLGKGTHEPIEFSLSSYHMLYQSLGTLVNALMMVDQEKLLDFCKSCFVLLKSHLQITVLLASLCLSRLLHRARSPTLLKRLRSAVALTFECCGDENCRTISGVMNNIIDRPMISEFESEDVHRILQGAIRGVAFPGPDLANECVAFVCKLIVLAPKQIVQSYEGRLWEIVQQQELSPLSLSAVAALLEIDNSFAHLQDKLRVERLLLATAGENNTVACKARRVLEMVCSAEGLPAVVSALKLALRTEFTEVCDALLERVTKTSVNVSIMDLLVLLAEESGPATPFRERVLGLFLAIVEDGTHILWEQAGDRLLQMLG